MLEEQTKVNFEYFIAGILVIVVLCVFFGIGAGFVTNCIGFFYPLYMTIGALEGSADDKFKWLIYWPLFVSVLQFETYGSFFVEWIPFYYPAKAAFFVYIMAPQLNGAQACYTAMKPYIAMATDKVDQALKEAGKSE